MTKKKKKKGTSGGVEKTEFKKRKGEVDWKLVRIR